MFQRGLKAKLLLWRARTNDAGIITDQGGENESHLKRLYLPLSNPSPVIIAF